MRMLAHTAKSILWASRFRGRAMRQKLTTSIYTLGIQVLFVQGKRPDFGGATKIQLNAAQLVQLEVPTRGFPCFVVDLV